MKLRWPPWVATLLSVTAFVIGWAAFVPASQAAGYGRPDKMLWTEMQKRYEGVFVLSAARKTRRIALTFDDVPDPRFTPNVLDILKRKGVHATFFVVGTRAKKHPDLVRRIHREGHVIGNHSYSHPDFSEMPIAKVKEQIRRTEDVLRKLIGFKPRLVRPPYGEILAGQLEWAKKSGYTVVNWDVDSSDWRQLRADQVFRNVTGAVRPGSIVLMHAGGGEGQNLSGTVKALPRMIDWLREHHYEPVTLTELLDVHERRILPLP
jgi:peptidoglycan/xylan/chitin deacetylase (PgdA/CDA1 family)